MRLRLPLVSFALIAAVCACGKQDPVANDLKATNLPLPVNRGMPDAAGGPPEASRQTRTAAPAQQPSTAIPQALQGRWGLNPEACTSSPGSAKGLLVVTADELRYYKSRAVPWNDVQTAGESINGTFRFTGEGQTWDKFEALQRNGDKLTRTETNPTASYTYAKC
jgi:hypothetical protein